MRTPTVSHKFKVGQSLKFVPPRMGSGLGMQYCKIVRLLPPEDGEPQYRIKCNGEAVERVVREHALIK